MLTMKNKEDLVLYLVRNVKVMMGVPPHIITLKVDKIAFWCFDY